VRLPYGVFARPNCVEPAPEIRPATTRSFIFPNSLSTRIPPENSDCSAGDTHQLSSRATCGWFVDTPISKIKALGGPGGDKRWGCAIGCQRTCLRGSPRPVPIARSLANLWRAGGTLRPSSVNRAIVFCKIELFGGKPVGYMDKSTHSRWLCTKTLSCTTGCLTIEPPIHAPPDTRRMSRHPIHRAHDDANLQRQSSAAPRLDHFVTTAQPTLLL
jgi:hypothetical protein